LISRLGAGITAMGRVGSPIIWPPDVLAGVDPVRPLEE